MAKSVFQAVPTGCPLFFTVNNPEDFILKFDSSAVGRLLLSMPQMSEARSEIEAVGQLVKTFCSQGGNLCPHDVVVSLNYKGDNQFAALGLVGLATHKDAMSALEVIKSEIEKGGWTLMPRKYLRTTIYDVAKPDGTETAFSFAENKGVLIFTKEPQWIEDAINQLEKKDMDADDEMSLLIKTRNLQSDINLFINHSCSSQLFSMICLSSLKDKVGRLKNYTRWTGLDVTLKPDKVIIGGFSVNTSSNSYYANVLKNQASVNQNIEAQMPSSSVYYLAVGLSDAEKYTLDYQQYLKSLNLEGPYEQQILKIRNIANVDVLSLFSSSFDEEAALVGTVDATGKQGQAFLMKVKSGSSALEQVLNLQKNYIRSMNLPGGGWSQQYKLDENASYTIYKNPFPKLPSIWFGDIFNAIEANWFTVYDNLLIMGDSYATVCYVLYTNIIGQTLGSETDFHTFQTSFTSSSNLKFFCTPGNAPFLLNKVCTKKIANGLTSQDSFNKLRMFGWQISTSGNMLYNNSCLFVSDQVKPKPKTIWQSRLDAPSGFRPQFVRNPSDPQSKDIVVQDQLGNFYLINSTGRILWKLKLDSKILGEVHQIDVSRKGKQQFLFNTENRIYLIDRDGNNVAKFPINLRAKATNELSVFDYDNNHTYRFFIACDDRKIYAYELSGNLVDGWVPFHTDHSVTQPIQHFRVEGKDYIVASDEMKDYILNRKGEVRVPTREVFPHSKNNKPYIEERTSKHPPRMVVSDNNGSLHYTYLDGATEVIEMVKLSDNHYFLSENLDSDPENEYLLADGQQVWAFDDNYKLLLNKQINGEISYPPYVYSFSGTKKIGFVSSETGKIYLIDLNGAYHEGFPLDGASPFSIGFFSNDSRNFNLLVNSPDGYLYNYLVE